MLLVSCLSHFSGQSSKDEGFVALLGKNGPVKMSTVEAFGC